MELRVLRYFLTIAREQNITKAAEVLNITQPTLSRQIIQLEQELGKKLFNRDKGKIRLTNDGMLLKRRAEELLDLAEKTEKEFKENKILISGEIAIGSGEANTFHFLSKIMSDFSKEYPQVKFDLFSGNADDIKEKIDNGLIDVALLNEPVSIEKYDFVRIPEKLRWGVLMKKDDLLAQQKHISSKDIVEKPLIVTKRSIVQNEIANWLKYDFNKLNIIAYYNLIYNATLLVEDGLGYAITIDKLVMDNPQSKVVFKPFYPSLETGCVIVWKKHQVFSPATTEFIEQLRNAL